MRPDAPSRTALVVAGGVVFAAGEPAMQDIVDPDAARLTRSMLRMNAMGNRLLRLIDSRAGRILIRLIERCTIPGVIRHWNCRKRWFEQAWRRAHVDGFDTMVVLGSGFDTLSLRVAIEPGASIRTIDVDHPATLAARRYGIAGHVPQSHTLVEHDLGQSGLGVALGGAISADSSTFVLIEGVLMYLEPGRVSRLFAELSSLKLRRLRVAFTFMECSESAPPAFRPRSRLVDLWLRWRGEPFRSGLDPDELKKWLEEQGFQLLDFSRTPGRAEGDANMLRGECAAVADRIEPPRHA